MNHELFKAGVESTCVDSYDHIMTGKSKSGPLGFTGKPKKYVEAGPEWPDEERRFTSQTFGARSPKNTLAPKPKKYEWANAEKTSWGKCQKNKWNTYEWRPSAANSKS